MDSQTKARVAESLLKAGRVTEAVAAIDAAIAMEPDQARLRYFRGSILFRAGRNAEAAPEFLKALELDPYMTDAHNFLGTVYSQMGRLTEAETHYQKALAYPAYPTPELVYLNLALLHATQGNDEKALSSLRRSVEINPRYYKAHFELASLLDRVGKLNEAAREYEVAAPAFRDSGDYFYRLGLVYFKLGAKQKSRESLRRAIDVAPGSESAASADELMELLR
jgi:tetratricopeptide (TPR) repeat protein